MHSPKFFVSLLSLSCLALLAGCLFRGDRTQRHSSSLVNYLYPRGMRAADTPAIPTLTLPLRVGVAWVPDGPGPGYGRSELTENQKLELLQKVVPHFRSYAFVRSIEIIPTTYLMPGGGFANLDQLRAIYGVDVIALVSHDQVQFTSEGLLSMAYWTVVGAYTIQGEKNETDTMIDAAVYDIASRKLLFRAPGVSRVKAASTLVNLSEQLRVDARRGFDQAATNMVTNLQNELARFRTRVEQAPQEFNVVRTPGYTGGGAIDWIGIGWVGIMGVAALRMKSLRTLGSFLNGKAPIWTLCVVALAGLVWLFPGSADLLIYDRNAILAGEIWRLWTGHLVHFSMSHVVLDGSAWLVCGWLLEARTRNNCPLLLLIGPPLISLSLFTFVPEMSRYGGLSALVVLAMVHVALNWAKESIQLRWLAGTALLLLGIKIAYELASPVALFASLPSAAVAPASHLAGAVLALLGSLVTRPTQPSFEATSSEASSISPLWAR